MAGFPGLETVCGHVLENVLLLAAYPVEEREPVLQFLRVLPPLMVFYLRNTADPSTAAGLVDLLRVAPSPLDEEQALKVMHQLGSLPQVADMADAHSDRPTVATPEDVALVVPEDVDQKLLEGFVQEAPGQARHLVGLIRNMADGTGAADDVVAAKRIAHTMKGTGATIGLRGLAALGHHFEDILEHFESRGGHVARSVAEVLLDAAYCLEQMVDYVIGDDAFPEQAQGVLQSVLDMANRIDRGEALEEVMPRSAVARTSVETPAAAAPESAPTQARRAPEGAGGGAASLRVALSRIEELFRVSGEVSVHTAAMEARVKSLTDRAQELLEQQLRVQKRLFELETLVDVRALTMMRGSNARLEGSGFDPLEMDQYNELHSTAHALVEEAADARMLSHRLEEDIAQLSGMQSRQQLLSRDLQHLVIGTRMTEVGLMESRLQRSVRSTCQATGKQAVLVLEGGDTLIDSDVLNRLAEPLLHIIRNAVDHGIEMPEERLRAGKPEAGTITLTFTRQGQQVVLRCRDDGRGLDLASIQRKAVERGLVLPEQTLNDDDVSRLVLQSGFSTRESVSEVSGRGVGLDVVREWALGMNGAVQVSSRQRQGCTIELRFAASLSTIQSLIVQAGDARFALPSVQIEQAVPREVGNFETANGQLLFRHGRRVMPARHLADLVGLDVDTDKSLADYDAVVLQVGERTLAISVDRLVDSRELLVQSPGRYAQHMAGVAGLSILGDGGVAVNLDLGQLLEAAAPRSAAGAKKVSKAARARAALPSVLIVDDALSVRNSLQQLIADAGFRAETARDGIEAIDAMRVFKPDVLLTDLEMPNMNGVELTSHVRGREDLRGLPIIMITSRSQDKHRQLAENAGVDVYITKPYNDGDLIQTIREALTAVPA